MKIVELLPESHGKVEYDGVERRISLRLLKQCGIGDYVLVHAGFAIEKLNPEKALEQLQLLRELKRELSS
ncbi:hypothetical protein SDC9_198042 [bioreactor metagenome]|uniref:Hydrogenase maturation factor HypC n=1 Tax=bioreactor metagenome TaxID=1076179 RepID=A0A645IHD9_9ZZZZ